MFSSPHWTSFNLGPLTFQVWGAFLSLGFLTGMLMALKEARRLKVHRDHVYNLVILSIIGAVLGSRLLFIWEHKEIIVSWQTLFGINEGGMSFYGGFLGALVLGSLYARIKKLDWKLMGDLAAPAVILGYIFGRIGCFLAGFHPGEMTSLPWAQSFFGEARHPAALYYILAGILIFGILWVLRLKIKRRGELFLLFLVLFSLHRLLLDFFRESNLYNPDPSISGLFMAQWISLGVLSLAGGLLFQMRQVKGDEKD